MLNIVQLDTFRLMTFLSLAQNTHPNIHNKKCLLSLDKHWLSFPVCFTNAMEINQNACFCVEFHLFIPLVSAIPIKAVKKRWQQFISISNFVHQNVYVVRITYLERKVANFFDNLVNGNTNTFSMSFCLKKKIWNTNSMQYLEQLFIEIQTKRKN